MGFGKTFGISIGIYFLLNAIFLFVYAAVGGVGGATIGAFFGLIGDDLWGFFTALLSPGGVQADVFTSLMYHVNMGANPYPVLTNIFGMVWVLVPGLVAAIFAGKSSNESSKSAFFGLMLAIFILSVLPIIFILIPALGISSVTAIGATIVPSMYHTPYLIIILAAIFNGAFFGGLAAMFSTNF
ncbi:hypothetical protein DSAG12_01555 [Promethearchaeum syntrophicum]|uniref:Uncharacterized protein n=1 Tax=Promethearchaeum syntrophicum TaxID=2594042 RepID=A0A5B9D8Y4_9ARCH|nr:hypothetical protein [Candidatus Prometheoarchaeum syntrophicum]QEE15728.1 hypothetical protein DSAG12_01555 [Candidatus Prometheoarchaeum syntrophicum]